MIEGNETISIARRTVGAKDEYGLPTKAGETLITVSKVLVAFDGSDEPVEANADPLNTDLTLYLPAGTVIQEGDEFIVRGERFVKASLAMSWLSPFTGTTPGVVVKVRQTRG